jgi:hypothetical protein
MTLVEFLLARITEDEAQLRKQDDYPDGRVHWPADCDWPGDAPHGLCTCSLHAQLLADCDAKRRILELHVQGGSLRGPITDNKFYCCAVCGPFSWPWLQHEEAPEPEGEFWPCPTLRLLALPYAGHPSYRPEWKP